MIVAVQTNAEWLRLCAAFDLPAPPEFATNALRVANRIALDAVLEPAFAALTAIEVIARLEAAAIAWGRQTELRDLGQHPALRRVQVTTDLGAVVSLPRPAGRDAGFVPGPVPALGAQTLAIRTEFAAADLAPRGA